MGELIGASFSTGCRVGAWAKVGRISHIAAALRGQIVQVAFSTVDLGPTGGTVNVADGACVVDRRMDADHQNSSNLGLGAIALTRVQVNLVVTP